MRRHTLALVLLTLLWAGCEDDPSLYADDTQALGSEEIDMASPLFVRTPIIAHGLVTSISGGAPTAIIELYEAVGPTLLERVLWATHETGAIDAGDILLLLVDPDGTAMLPIAYQHVEAYDPAPEATSFVCGEIRLDIAVVEGWKLYATTTVEQSIGGDAGIALTLQAGEVE